MVFQVEERPEVQHTGLEDFRRRIGLFIKGAETEGTHTVVRRHGKPAVVLVSADWYIAHGGDIGTVPVAKPPAS